MRIIGIFLLFICFESKAKLMVVPMESSTLNIELASDFNWKNTCKNANERFCYQIWKDDNYFALSSQKVNEKNPLKKICGVSMKTNKNKVSYCEYSGSLFFSKEDQLFVVSYSGKKKTSKALNEFAGGIK